MKVELPAGWTARGELPDPSQGMRYEDLDEDLWQAALPDYSLVIDVGWYPEGDPDGAFTCLLIENEDWSRPLRRLRTKRLDEVSDWIAEAIRWSLVRGIRSLSATSYSSWSWRPMDAGGIHAAA